LQNKVLMKKYLDNKNLSCTIQILKNQKKKIVLCHGVFDLVHLGHIKHFDEAKSKGDVLVVSVTSNKYVQKGPGRPFFDEIKRVEFLSHLKMVDYLFISNSKNALQSIKKVKPDIYCKGPDYKNNDNDITGQIEIEKKMVKKFGGKISYTDDETFSSSKLINQTDMLYSKSQKLLIKNVKKKYSFNQIHDLFKKISNLKVLVIGETIIDQYCFGEIIGKSGKESHLVFKSYKSEDYLGGAFVISKNVSNFVKTTEFISYIGSDNKFLKKVKKNQNNNLKINFIKKKNSPTILKRRYVDQTNNIKLFGVYDSNDDLLNSKEEKELFDKIKNKISKYDLVIVSDFGHGLISKKIANLICSKAKYLALNTQINSSNLGFHSLKNYKKSDCLIINERELRYELRDKNSKIDILMKNLSEKQRIKNLIVTRGSKGSVLFNRNSKKFFYCPALANKIIDKIGAGDSMLSLVSLSLYAKFNENLSLLTGSLAALQSVETIGNKSSINKISLIKSLRYILK